MAIQLRNILKSFFNTGDRPTENQFSDLVDSFVHQNENKASTAEIQTGTNNSKYVTPAGAKASVQTFTPIKTVNGINPVSGNVTINTGGGTTVGSTEFGVVKFFTTTSNSTNIFHLKLPHRLDLHNAMFHFEAKGYVYNAPEIIDIVWVGYCYKDGNVLKQTKTEVIRSSVITAGQYLGTDNHIYLWFKVPNTFYCSFKVDSIKVGNGFQVYDGDIEVIVSSQTHL